MYEAWEGAVGGDVGSKEDEDTAIEEDMVIEDGMEAIAKVLQHQNGVSGTRTLFENRFGVYDRV